MTDGFLLTTDKAWQVTRDVDYKEEGIKIRLLFKDARFYEKVAQQTTSLFFFSLDTR